MPNLRTKNHEHDTDVSTNKSCSQGNNNMTVRDDHDMDSASSVFYG